MALVYRVTTNFCPLLSTFYCKCTVNITRFKSKKRSNEPPRMKNDHAKPAYGCVQSSFQEAINFRQHEARRSILLQLETPNSAVDCKRHCQKYGKIANIFHYVSKLESQNFVLVEFESNSSVEEMKRAAVHLNSSEYIPIPTTLLWFYSKMHSNKNNYNKRQEKLNEVSKINLSASTHDLIKETMQPLNSVADQIFKLHNLLKLSDLDVRLRFYTAYQLQLCFSGLFPTISVLPFGSSVNGFGQIGCDLDLVCRLNSQMEHRHDTLQKLVFQSKYYPICDRQQQRDFLSILAAIMHKFIPSICNVNKILQARVPIIKFLNKCTNVQCDLSCTQLVASYMSELLYIYGQIDNRVKPLICTIRKWAKCHQITTDTSGQWITNFSLTLLIIFYFQLKGILPPLNQLGQYAKSSSSTVTFDNQFIMAVRQMQSKNKNTESLHSLLYGFFEYYATFDFTTRGICIREGRSKLKRDDTPIYIYNPFEPTLNVSKNVTTFEVVRLKSQIRNALYALENDGPNTIAMLLGLVPLQHPSTEVLKDYDSVDVNDKLAENVSKPDKIVKEQNGDSDPKSEQSKLIKKEFLTDEDSFDDSKKLKEIIK